MKIIFYDSNRRSEVTSFYGKLSDAPLPVDSVVLKSSIEYEKIYGYSDRSAIIESRSIDYRNDSIVLFLDK